MVEQIAERDWYTRALVHVLKTTITHSHWTERTFQAGEELEMVQWGRAGRTVDRSAWWTDFDIDGAHIIGADKVAVVKVLAAVSPYEEETER